MRLSCLKELRKNLDLSPKDALTWARHVDGVASSSPSPPGPTPPQTFDLALILMLTPTTPYPSLFAVPQATWLGHAQAIRPTCDMHFGNTIALRCEPKLAPPCVRSESSSS